MDFFGKKLGVGRTAISDIENGRNNLSNQMIASICNATWDGKKVNEDWLRTGQGEMFLLEPQDKLEALAAAYGLDSKELLMIREFVTMDPGKRASVIEYAERIAAGLLEISGEQDPESPEDYRKRKHEELDRQIDLEESMGAKSEVS